jgi:hypothetical protein
MTAKEITSETAKKVIKERIEMLSSWKDMYQEFKPMKAHSIVYIGAVALVIVEDYYGGNDPQISNIEVGLVKGRKYCWLDSVDFRKRMTQQFSTSSFCLKEAKIVNGDLKLKGCVGEEYWNYNNMSWREIDDVDVTLKINPKHWFTCSVKRRKGGD